MSEIKDKITLEEEVKSGKRFFVLFYTSWCSFSRKFLPIFEKYDNLKGYKAFLLVIVDDEENTIWEKYRVKDVPTVIAFEKGRIIARLDAVPSVGLSEKQLREFLGE